MKSNYDNAAIFYDHLSRLVYGSALVNAQVYLLKTIPAGAHILIAGGGTGWVLEEIAKIHPAGLTIDYAEVSAKMMAKAAKRNVAGNKVTFINKPVQDIEPTPGGYDMMLTAFLFDNFSEETTQKVFPVIDRLLKPGGMWLYCDFCNTNRLLHKLLLKSMYVFFGLLCGVETTQLPDMAGYFEQYGYTASAREIWMKGFIEAVVYKRNSLYNAAG